MNTRPLAIRTSTSGVKDVASIEKLRDETQGLEVSRGAGLEVSRDAGLDESRDAGLEVSRASAELPSACYLFILSNIT